MAEMSIKDFLDAMGQPKEKVDQLLETISKLGFSASESAEKIVHLKNVQQTLGLSSDQLKLKIHELTGQSSSEFYSWSQSVTKALTESKEQFSVWAQKNEESISKTVLVASGLTTFFDSFNPISSFAERQESSLYKMNTSLLGLLGSGDIKKFAEGIYIDFEKVNSAERAIYALSASAGTLSKTFGDIPNIAAALDGQYQTLTKSAFETAEATNISMGKALELSKALAAIPGALGEIVTIGGVQQQQLSAVLTMGAGAGVEASKVIADLNKLYLTLGTTGQDATKELAAVYKAAQDAEMPLSIVTSSVQQMAQGFKLLGDNTLAATNLMTAFGQAFKASGANIGPEVMAQIVTGISSGIERMDYGKKAFISEQSGGTGGLAGALKVDLALQEGRMDEVVKMTMETMQKQFGTSPLTLKQAAESPELASEFYKQVSFLKDVAGIAGTDKEAYRILEAMQSGVIDGIKSFSERGDGADVALKESVDRGIQIQDMSRTHLASIDRRIEMGTAARAMARTEVARETIKLNPEMAIRERMEGITAGAKERPLTREGSENDPDFASKAVKLSVDYGKEVFDEIKRSFSEFFTSSSKVIKSDMQQAVETSLKSQEPTKTNVNVSGGVDVNIRMENKSVGVIKVPVSKAGQAATGVSSEPASSLPEPSTNISITAGPSSP